MTGSTDMRLLFAVSEMNPGDEVGYHAAFKEMIATGELQAFDSVSMHWLAAREGWPMVWDQLYKKAVVMKPTVLFIQNFHFGEKPPEGWYESIRDACPDIQICCSTGDAFRKYTGSPLPDTFIDVGRHADVMFLCGVGRLARQFIRRGVKRIVFLPNSFCQIRFNEPLDRYQYKPEYDVVFIGNRLKPLNPVHYAPGYIGRNKLVKALSKKYGSRFALFGKGWDGLPSARGRLTFDQQHVAYRNAKVAIGHPMFTDIDFYCSNRTYIGIASSIPYLDRYVPGLDCLFRNGEHTHMYHDIDHALELCDKLVNKDHEKCLDKAIEAAQFMREKHTNSCRMKTMFHVLRQLKQQTQVNEAGFHVHVDYFLPECSVDDMQDRIVFEGAI